MVRDRAKLHEFGSDSVVRGCIRGLCLLLLISSSAVVRAQSVLDETVAIVNGELVAKSDLLWNLALDKSVSPEDFWKPRIQRFMLETVVDQRLVLQEAATLPAIRVSDEEIEEKIKEITMGFASAEDPDRFVRRQALVGLTRQRLEEMVRDRLRIEKFEDFRFKSFVVVTEAEIEQYFETKIRPDLTAQGVVITEQEKAKHRQDAEKGIVNDKTLQAIETYLAKAREGAQITYFGDWGRPVGNSAVIGSEQPREAASTRLRHERSR
jgi:hypothetical protein